MNESHKPKFKAFLDVGNGWQEISSYVTKWDSNLGVTSRTNTASLNVDYNALLILQQLDSSAKIKILAGYDSNNLKLIFDGLVQSIKKTNTKEEFDLEAEDFASFMLNRFITDAFAQEKAVDIIKDILSEKIPEYTWDIDSFDDNDFIVEKIAFEDKPIIEIIEYLAELIGFDFWVTSDGEGLIKFHCKIRKSIESDFVLQRGVNLKTLVFIEDKSQMANRVIVEGDKREFAKTQRFTGNGVTKEYSLVFKPHNTRVSVNGVNLIGGVEGISQNPEFFVDFFEKKVTLVNTPALMDQVVIDYTYDIPIKVEATDFASIKKYGEKVQFIKNKNIKEKSEAKKYAREFIKQYGKPLFIAEADAPASVDFNVGEVITVKDLSKGINHSMQVLECSYSFSKREGFTSSLKLAQTTQTGSNILKDIILRLKQVEELLKGDVEVVTKLTTFEDTITIRIKRITAKKRSLLQGFTWSKEGVWNHNDWGVDNTSSFQTFFEYGDKDVVYKDTSYFAEHELNLEVIFSPELNKILVFSYNEWTQNAYSGKTEFTIPTPTILKEVIDNIRHDLDNLSFGLSLHSNYSAATIWSLNGASPPYWSKIGFTKTTPAGAPSQRIFNKIEYENIGITEQNSFELSLQENYAQHVPMWSMNYVWSRTGIEESTQITPYDQSEIDQLHVNDKLSLAQEFLSDFDNEFIYSRASWNKKPIIDYGHTENIILKEIKDYLTAEDRTSLRFNELEDGFFWSVRGWSKDDWGNIPRGLAQQDIQNRTESSSIASSDKIFAELSWSEQFDGWSLKYWSKNGWIKFQQEQQSSTYSKTETESLIAEELIGIENINSLNNQISVVNTRSKWSEATW